MIKVSNLRGVDAELAELLVKNGIRYGEELLAAAATPSQRLRLAEDLGVDVQAILDMANRADLSRINGIGGIYSDLLEHSGVDTVKELAQRRPDNLYQAIVSANRQRQLAKMPPSEDMIDGWIKQARIIQPMLQY